MLFQEQSKYSSNVLINVTRGFRQPNIKPNKSNIKPVLHKATMKKETHLIKVIFSKLNGNINFPN